MKHNQRDAANYWKQAPNTKRWNQMWKKNTLHSDSINVKPFKPGSKTIYFTGVHAPVIDRVCWHMSMIMGLTTIVRHNSYVSEHWLNNLMTTINKWTVIFL